MHYITERYPCQYLFSKFFEYIFLLKKDVKGGRQTANACRNALQKRGRDVIPQPKSDAISLYKYLYTFIKNMSYILSAGPFLSLFSKERKSPFPVSEKNFE